MQKRLCSLFRVLMKERQEVKIDIEHCATSHIAPPLLWDNISQQSNHKLLCEIP